MYVWGHSYEFGDSEERWKLIEDFTDMMQGKDDIWYATNGEIFDYITATKRLEFSANRDKVFNPSTIDIWYRGKNEEPMVIHGGETITLN